MTDAELNIAIAKFCGFRENPDLKGFFLHDNYPYNISPLQIPNYAGDLNAMAQVEKSLSEDEFENYLYHLITPLAVMRDGISTAGARKCTFATARQRAEAFVKVMGKDL